GAATRRSRRGRARAPRAPPRSAARRGGSRRRRAGGPRRRRRRARRASPARAARRGPRGCPRGSRPPPPPPPPTNSQAGERPPPPRGGGRPVRDRGVPPHRGGVGGAGPVEAHVVAAKARDDRRVHRVDDPELAAEVLAAAPEARAQLAPERLHARDLPLD